MVKLIAIESKGDCVPAEGWSSDLQRKQAAVMFKKRPLFRTEGFDSSTGVNRPAIEYFGIEGEMNMDTPIFIEGD